MYKRQANIFNWRDARPVVNHENVVISYILGQEGVDKRSIGPVLQSPWSLTRHYVHPRKNGDYHDHTDKEQVFYVISGTGKMKLDGTIHDIKAGDVIHAPVLCKHQIINETDEWLELIVISVDVK